MNLPELSAARLGWALAACLAWLGLCAFYAWQASRQRRAWAQAQTAMQQGAEDDTGLAPVWLLWASQTGRAQALAVQSAQTLKAAGRPVRALPLHALDPAELAAHARHGGLALFVVSTAGEGDPPDEVAPYVARHFGQAVALAGLHCGVLALGDRQYPQFCAFGKRLAQWLAGNGAAELFEPLCCDAEDPATLRRWRQQLAHLAGTADAPDWVAPACEPWQLLARQHLNPGSAGAPLHLITLSAPASSTTDWEAGDLVQIEPPGPGADSDAEDRRTRDYSVASIPAIEADAADAAPQRQLQLLVRLHRHVTEQGQAGTGRVSGWLCEQALPGATVPLRLRAHPHFRLGANQARPLILIGNGSGLAGLRAHLQGLARLAHQRQALMDCGLNAWLLLGERSAAHDQLCQDETDRWLASRVLSQLDRVYSRDQPDAPYVQHRLRAEAPRLQRWLQAGAALYLCGSLNGMAREVDATLAELLGQDGLDELRQQGRLRKDVY
ncbi:NADPH cytochrome P450 oxidoreductase family protein [Ideonella sp.]|uniref:NADPH cytochrome P450 oxidoreductase family protein n=1 Tax=Ideonella sp. TaxID=1929293 RepID=UPI003BB4BA83